MELTGSQIIAADCETVWKHLNDPDTLKASIPGCTEMTGNAGEGFEAVVRQKIGPVKATFRGQIALSNVVPGRSYTITGEGKGGVAGFARGGADVTLNPVPEGCELSYTVNARVGGKLAQLGNRLIQGFARKMADTFFENFRRQVEDGEGSGKADAGEDNATQEREKP